MSNAITVLIVDDNAYMRETLVYLLSQSPGISVIGQAKNGMEAISMAEELFPDIILLDINMSPINGFEAGRKILKSNPAAKIIGISVHKQGSYARNMMQLGAKGYLTKTSPHKEILEAIQKYIQEKNTSAKN